MALITRVVSGGDDFFQDGIFSPSKDAGFLTATLNGDSEDIFGSVCFSFGAMLEILEKS